MLGLQEGLRAVLTQRPRQDTARPWVGTTGHTQESYLCLALPCQQLQLDTCTEDEQGGVPWPCTGEASASVQAQGALQVAGDVPDICRSPSGTAGLGVEGCASMRSQHSPGAQD